MAVRRLDTSALRPHLRGIRAEAERVFQELGKYMRMDKIASDAKRAGRARRVFKLCAAPPRRLGLLRDYRGASDGGRQGSATPPRSAPLGKEYRLSRARRGG